MTGRREIFHIAYADDWDAARRAGEYRISTKGRTLDEQGFIHASTDTDQVERVGRLLYADEPRPLVVLVVDTSALEAPVVDENLEGGTELFPHVYGPIPADAVVATIPVTTGPGAPFAVAWDGRTPTATGS